MSIIRKYKISILTKKPLNYDVLYNLKFILKYFHFKKENYKVIDEYYDKCFNLKIIKLSESSNLCNYVFYVNNDNKLIFYYASDSDKIINNHIFVNFNYLKMILHFNMGVKKLSNELLSDIIINTFKFGYSNIYLRYIYYSSNDIEAEFEAEFQNF